MHQETVVTAGEVSSPLRKSQEQVAGVKDASVSFMTLKMSVEFEEGADPKEVMPRVLANCKKVEDDCEIFF